MVTLAVGCVSNATVKVAVVPASEVVRPEIATTLIRGVSLS